ncbi:MAG TPA: cytochrome b/b6 domain-containing protein [Ignavibacteriaceae bacterium]|nr:cytochrome b/b6 domain-containing protein [Ignavibacteriaceae bacterium]
MTMEKNGKEVSLYVNQDIFQHSAHGKLNCISCHIGFNPEDVPHKEKIEPINCLTCHTDAKAIHAFHPQMLTKANGVSGTQDVSCKNCHGTHDVSPIKNPDGKWGKKNLITSCGSCHKEAKEKFVLSEHGKAFAEGVEGAPNCISCHQSSIVSVNKGKNSLQIKLNQQKLCLSCHLDDPKIRARTTPSAGFIQAYEHSVHGEALNKGNANAPSCTNCHNHHDIESSNSVNSSINKINIPETCGNCHTDIASQYKESIHGTALLQKGISDAPTCTDCHGEHNILKHTNPDAPVAYKNLSSEVCSPCHSSVQLVQKFDLPTDRFKSYVDSYHGLALEGGSTVVANCASCHGVHNIKPSSDPTSSVNKNNLASTCGKCHPGANQNFAKGKIHVIVTRQEEPILYWISTIYIILIISTIGGMFLHNILDFIKKAKIKKMKQRGIIPEARHGHSLYLRMTVNERIQHLALLISFITLVITGFMLKFPGSWWVEHIRSISQNAFEYRSILHRIAAVVMVAASLFHLYYIIFTERGRQLVKDLLPKFQDLLDAIGVAKYNLGISKEKPLLDRFSYVEKAEYWALVWGTIVMTATGFIMWFDNTFIGLLTKLGWDIANTIHYYEAWLAFLAIVVWHFYFIIFNPEVYPMNLAWIKGTITEEEMADEHPKELARLKNENRKNGNQSDEFSLADPDMGNKNVEKKINN